VNRFNRKSIICVSIIAFLVAGSFTFAAEKTPVPPRKWADVADGFASVNAMGQNGTTGGAGGKTVTVTTFAELKEYAAKKEPYVIRVKGSIDMTPAVAVRGIDVAYDKTIIGEGKNAGLVKGGMYVGRGGKGIHYPRAHNVIIRNLTIHHSVNDSDGVTMDNCHHIWIDHCHFHHNADGCIDSRMGTSYFTVSWCIFSDHNKTFGIGWDKKVTAQLTVHHNWFRNVNQRNPCVDNALRAHLYNNYLQNVKNYGNWSRGRTNMILQNSVFENVSRPHVVEKGTLVATGNIYRNTTDKQWPWGAKTRGPAFFDPAKFYKYTLDDAKDLPKILLKYAGPQENIGQ